jgi:hypothetical protein
MFGLAALANAGNFVSTHQGLNARRRDIQQFRHEQGIDREVVTAPFDDHRRLSKISVRVLPHQVGSAPDDATIHRSDAPQKSSYRHAASFLAHSRALLQ